MKLVKLNFTYFSGVNWDHVETTILAQDMKQLKAAFEKEAQWYHGDLSIDELWQKNKIYAKIIELKFPLVVQGDINI